MPVSTLPIKDLLSTQSRAIPSFMSVYGVESSIYIKEIEVNQELGKHDSILIRAEFSVNDPAVLVDKPFQIRYGLAPYANVFYGYIDSLLKNQQLNSTIDVTIQGLGWTSIMRRGTRRILEGSTLSEVVRTVAKPHGFRYSVTEPKFSSYREAQVEESDWSFLVRTAGNFNRFVSTVNGVLWLLDPIAELDKRKSYLSFSRNEVDHDSRNFLLDYQPVSLSADLSSYKDTVGFSYLNDKKEVVTKSPKATAGSTNYFTGYIPNADWAKRVEDMLDLTGFHSGTARINGNALIVPGTVCNFTTTRPGQRPVDKFDGLWLVSAVQHKLGANFFQTNLGLLRDKTRTQIVNSPYVWPFATRPGKLIPFNVVNKRWRML